MVFFLDVTDIKPCPDLSPNQNALRIASGTEPTLIRKEDMTPLISCLVFVHSAPLCRPRAVTTNLSNSCTCGVERFPSERNDTFVDSEFCSYTGDDITENVASLELSKFLCFLLNALLRRNVGGDVSLQRNTPRDWKPRSKDDPSTGSPNHTDGWTSNLDKFNVHQLLLTTAL
ncbi:hypothetical protein TNCV_4355271 [Trichonephila clavipes]|nr:hypothetical protein TNCV_4355271 [Trichonephila clavipes]